jgi:hypothetical protein
MASMEEELSSEELKACEEMEGVLRQFLRRLHLDERQENLCWVSRQQYLQPVWNHIVLDYPYLILNL